MEGRANSFKIGATSIFEVKLENMHVSLPNTLVSLESNNFEIVFSQRRSACRNV
jgi:hypothetical protein